MRAFVNWVLEAQPCCCTAVCLAFKTARHLRAAAAAVAVAADPQLLQPPDRSMDTMKPFCLLCLQTRSARSSMRWMSASGWWCPASSGTRWAAVLFKGRRSGSSFQIQFLCDSLTD